MYFPLAGPFPAFEVSIFHLLADLSKPKCLKGTLREDGTRSPRRRKSPAVPLGFKQCHGHTVRFKFKVVQASKCQCWWRMGSPNDDAWSQWP